MSQEGPDENGLCVPKCVWFRCARNALEVKESTLWCTWLSDNCYGASCSYGECSRHLLMPKNRCGLTIKRRDAEPSSPDDLNIDFKAKGRLAQRLDKDRDFV